MFMHSINYYNCTQMEGVDPLLWLLPLLFIVGAPLCFCVGMYSTISDKSAALFHQYSQIKTRLLEYTRGISTLYGLINPTGTDPLKYMFLCFLQESVCVICKRYPAAIRRAAVLPIVLSYRTLFLIRFI
jgi:hypothetical protein